MENCMSWLKKINVKSELIIDKIFNLIKKRFIIFMIIACVVSFCVRTILLRDSNYILIDDCYVYLRKAVEITQGNWIPVRTQAIGWSAVLAFFFIFIPNISVYQQMIISVVVAIGFEAATIIPIALCSKRMFKIKYSVISVLIYVAWIPRREEFGASTGSTEPLFTFLFAMCFYFILLSRDKFVYIYVAMIIGGYASITRPNGIVILFILIVCHFVVKIDKDWKKRVKTILLASTFFFISSCPFLIERTVIFGSPFDYGANSKLFLDDYNMVWASNITEGYSIIDYLATHSFQQLFDRFVLNGVVKILYHFIIFVIPAVLLVFFVVGTIKSMNKKRFFLSCVVVIFVSSLVPVYGIIGRSRYLMVLVPFITILSTSGIKSVIKREKKHSSLLKVSIITTIMISLIYTPVSSRFSSRSDIEQIDGIEWGNRIGNINNSVVICTYYGATMPLIEANDTEVFNRSLGNYYSPSKNITVLVSGYFESVTDYIIWLESVRATHIITDELSRQYRPFTSDLSLYSEFTLWYSNYNTTDEWKVNIYEFNQ